ncbi:MAG: hypothetical protein P8J86_01840 [Phycisphaerales bacterium]|jgi:hypothetical protein|nr:hypothetical protein [Phycisphaerales bacterium]
MMLAWIPFLQPFPELVVGWYWLCIPLVIGVAMVYKALWIDQDGPWARQVAVMSGLVVSALILVGVLLGVFVQLVIPILQ